MKGTKGMKVDLKKETFCEAVDSIERYWRTIEKISNFGLNIYECEDFTDIADRFSDFLSELLELEHNDVFGDDISYYMVELDFGKKWQPGMVIQDGKDIKLQNSQDLWDLIVETKKNS